MRPPHTAASLKRYICKIEGVEGPEKAALYLPLSEEKPSDDSARLALRGNSGPGSSEVDPVVLIVDKGAAEKRRRSASNVGSNELPAWEFEQTLWCALWFCSQKCFKSSSPVYYRLFDDDGETVSKTSFDESDSSLGRIEISTIPPPLTVASLKDRLVHVERVSGKDVPLLENEDGEVTLSDGDAIALLTDDFPGSKADQPIVFTYTPNFPDKTMAPQIPSFSKRLTATANWTGGSLNGMWHSMVVEEIFQTDGVLGENLPCFVGINSSGKEAFVPFLFKLQALLGVIDFGHLFVTSTADVMCDEECHRF